MSSTRLIPTRRSRLSVTLAPLALSIVLLGAPACGPDSRLPTAETDANPGGELSGAAADGRLPGEERPGHGEPLTAVERRAVERRRALAASMPPPEPATAAALADHVEERARRLAAIEWAPYRPPESSFRERLADLSYEDYRRIEFRPEAALWRDEARFELQLAHPGFLYRDPVRIHVVRDGRVRTVPLDPARFRYGRGLEWLVEAVGPETGHAGFRVYYPLDAPVEAPGDEDLAAAEPPAGAACASCTREVAVFLGASYFRLLGRGHVHGLSARGLAVDVVGPDGEEFPVFREFWILRPGPEDAALTFLALLDSPSVTGAYRFELEPGERTTLGVDARLYARRDVGKLGVAPLTSMFLYGPDRGPEFDDFRPEVHDSDGLLMHTSVDEWIWRPLVNRRALRATWLGDRGPEGSPREGPRGFGLVQRERRFDSYLDLEALYHRRPSLWVAPVEGDWGDGGVELVEIPTRSEFNDNIVAYWAPDRPFRAGDERHYRYRLTTFDRRLEEQDVLLVERTGIGWDALPGQSDPPPRSRRRFVVDFGPGGVPLAEGAVEAAIETTSGTVSDVVVQRLPEGGGWRVAFDLEPDDGRPADLRLFLHAGDRRLTETWSYVWYPEQAR